MGLVFIFYYGCLPDFFLLILQIVLANMVLTLAERLLPLHTKLYGHLRMVLR